MVVQGRELSTEDIGLIQGLLVAHRDWSRTRLSEEICRMWDWRNARGRIKDMAARSMLLKLERGGFIRLPDRLRLSTNGFRNRNAPLMAHASAPICGALRDLRPLAVRIVEPVLSLTIIRKVVFTQIRDESGCISHIAGGTLLH